MVIMAAQIKSATAAQVRQWATDTGREVGSRGRFNPALVAEFNKAHKRNRLQYVEGQWETTTEVTVKPAKGRKVTKAVNMGKARQWAKANGYEVGARGPVPEAALNAYVLHLAGVTA